MVDHHEPFYPIFFIALLGIIVISSFLLVTPRFVGHVAVVGTGGQVTALNIQVSSKALSWIGLYGNLTMNASNASFLLSGGNVAAINLSYNQSFTPQTVIIASVSGSPNWSSLIPATHAQINTFMGLSDAHSLSSENTLLEVANVTMGSVEYEVLSATTVSSSGTYRTSAFNDNGSLLFVTKPVVGVGFEGVPVDFQLLLPVSTNGSITYSFFVFEQDNLPVSNTLDCNSSINLSTIVAADNSSVFVSWDEVLGATGYELVVVDGPLNGYLNSSLGTTIILGASSSYLDVSPSAERYYFVRVLQGGSSCVAKEVSGTLALNLSSEYNLVSTPFIHENASVGEVLRSINGEYSEVLVMNNANKVFNFYIIVGANTFKNFDDIESGKGYWVKTTGNASLRLAGVLKEGINESVVPEYNLVGFPTISNSNQSANVSTVLSSIDGEYNEVLVLNNANKVFEYYIIVGANTFKNFDDIESGKGYWVKTTTNTSLIVSKVHE